MANNNERITILISQVILYQNYEKYAQE